MRGTCRLLVRTVFFTLLSVTYVYAQTSPPPARQPQGLFGGVRPDAAAKTRLDFSASLIEGYDTDVPSFFLSSVDPSSVQSGGFSTIIDTSAAYAWRSARTQVGVNGTSVFRHYADVGETRAVGSSVGIGASTRLPGRTTLLVNQSAAYSPADLSWNLSGRTHGRARESSRDCPGLHIKRSSFIQLLVHDLAATRRQSAKQPSRFS